MLLSRILLFIQGAMGVVYAIILAVNPSGLAGYMGLATLSGDGQAELFAMYIGMTAAVGAIMLWVVFSQRYIIEATICLAIIISGIALSRTAGWLIYDTGSYTLSALAYDIPMSFMAWFAVYRGRE